MGATSKQIEYIRDLADEAGYTGDRAYNAARDLIGDGRGWKDSRESASALIDALLAKLGRRVTTRIETASSPTAGTEAPIVHTTTSGVRWMEY